nr:uncharacterized protein LOC116153896 [Camelus dromedarius]
MSGGLVDTVIRKKMMLEEWLRLSVEDKISKTRQQVVHTQAESILPTKSNCTYSPTPSREPPSKQLPPDIGPLQLWACGETEACVWSVKGKCHSLDTKREEFDFALVRGGRRRRFAPARARGPRPPRPEGVQAGGPWHPREDGSARRPSWQLLREGAARTPRGSPPPDRCYHRADDVRFIDEGAKHGLQPTTRDKLRSSVRHPIMNQSPPATM